MKRAMRLDKISIAALSSTLRLYLDPDKIRSRIPTLRLLSRDLEEIKITAIAIKNRLTSILNNDVIIDQIDCLSQIGSGSLPVNRLPSTAIVLRPKNRNVDPVILMNSLYQQTDLETKFFLNLNVLNEKLEPKVMSLKDVLNSFLKHRYIILEKKTKFLLNKINLRLEILKGFLIV